MGWKWETKRAVHPSPAVWPLGGCAAVHRGHHMAELAFLGVCAGREGKAACGTSVLLQTWAHAKPGEGRGYPERVSLLLWIQFSSWFDLGWTQGRSCEEPNMRGHRGGLEQGRCLDVGSDTSLEQIIWNPFSSWSLMWGYWGWNWWH